MFSDVQRALLGGTFDPPHLAHLMAAESAYRSLGMDVVTFLPAGVPWQKLGSDVSPADDRWEMTQRAINGISYFEADDREVRRDGWTYTIDTLESFGGDLTLVLGADAAARLPSWNRVEDVLDLAEIAVMDRPGTSRSAVETAVGRPVRWLDAPMVDVSATMLRARVARGSSIRFLVREGVYEYVLERGLYVT